MKEGIAFFSLLFPLFRWQEKSGMNNNRGGETADNRKAWRGPWFDVIGGGGLSRGNIRVFTEYPRRLPPGPRGLPSTSSPSSFLFSHLVSQQSTAGSGAGAVVGGLRVLCKSRCQAPVLLRCLMELRRMWSSDSTFLRSSPDEQDSSWVWFVRPFCMCKFFFIHPCPTVSSPTCVCEYWTIPKKYCSDSIQTHRKCVDLAMMSLYCGFSCCKMWQKLLPSRIKGANGNPSELLFLFVIRRVSLLDLRQYFSPVKHSLQQWIYLVSSVFSSIYPVKPIRAVDGTRGKPVASSHLIFTFTQWFHPLMAWLK